jgi:hypothetical protein
VEGNTQNQGQKLCACESLTLCCLLCPRSVRIRSQRSKSNPLVKTHNRGAMSSEEDTPIKPRRPRYARGPLSSRACVVNACAPACLAQRVCLLRIRP